MSKDFQVSETIDTEEALSARSVIGRLAARFQITIEHLWLGVPVFVLLWKSFIYPLPVLDFWWHLKMGEVIATTRSIPRMDLFSFTAAGQPYVLQNWLAEILFYATYLAGGFPLLVFLNTALTLAAFLLIYKLCFEATTKLRIAVLVGFLAAIGNYSFLRPQTFSFLIFAAYSFVLVRYRSRRRDLLWTLPLLMVLWVNLHGGFVMGLGLAGIYLVSEISRRFIDPSRKDALTGAELRKLALVLVLCGLATLINPESYKVYEYVRTVLTDAGSQQLVAEWQPPRVNQILGIILFYGPFFIGLLAFTFARVKPDLTETMLFGAFAIFAMMSIRNAAWFGTVAYPIIARYLPVVDLRPLMALRRFRLAESVCRWAAESESKRPVYNRINILFASLAVVLLVSQSPWVRPAVYKTPLWDEQTPVGAADFMHRQGLTGNIFHPQIFGDYLIWRLWPEQKSFFDGRVHLYGLEFIRQYSRLLSDSHWEDLLARWNIKYLLFHKSSDDKDNLKAIQAARGSSRWRQIYEDDISVLYEKTALPKSE